MRKETSKKAGRRHFVERRWARRDDDRTNDSLSRTLRNEYDSHRFSCEDGIGRLRWASIVWLTFPSRDRWFMPGCASRHRRPPG